MKKISLSLFVASLFFMACNNDNKKIEMKTDNKDLAALFENYYKERMQLVPLESTQNGDTINNDKLFADFTDSYREKYKQFFSRYLDEIKKYNRDELSENDQLSYDIFKREMEMTLEGLSLGWFANIVTYPDHRYIPFTQFGGVPIWMGQSGSGDGSQPFKTITDYDNWLKRATAFSVWTDSAIIYFRKGIAANVTLPQPLVKKMIDEMDAMVVSDATKSLFYGPINKIPQSFSDSDRKRMTTAFVQLINQQLVPSYKRLSDFLKTEYLPKARTTTGINAVPDGDKYYNYLIRFWTTTNKTPDEIYQTGLSEVKRIRGIMDSVKNAVGFTGDLNAFFQYMRTDKRFTPFKTPDDVLNATRSILARIQPNVKKMFTHEPKSPFEIRQTEAFRAASASAEYIPGSPDGKRPGIYYIPIVDATKFNTTSGMESTFLHEAIPGHHYQISIQQENSSLPKFRRFAWYGAYGEGWALYCESLGKELGVYTDPYQYMGALGDEIHRAIRLVVDPAIHTGKMTREEAIKYMMDNEAVDEQGATAEIERYMAVPAQALSYKIGALKIRELRNKYQQQLGSKFNLAAFHDEFLKDGCMPLEVAEKKMDAWAERQK
ncbi:MAG TPA: DUF885 domain-containing protein [Chitinophagaceae bacterium]|jgi:uncharacterized protein (DUF885 family)|nr:DUF885 domain-containing protein [Chitinophagaceae bacterium]